MKNPLKTKLRDGKTTFGTAVSIDHSDVAEVMGQVGYDWILFDTEHAPLDVRSIQSLIQALKPSEAVPLVRVAWNDLVLIKRVLDVGAYGVVVPWVNSRDDARRAVQAIRYPPQGLRGYGPRRAALFDSEYARTANSELLLAVQIETQKAVDNVDEILSVEGIDAAFIGPYDLSMSLGVFEQWDSPKFVNAVSTVLKSAQRNGVVPGVLAPTEWQKRLREGFRMILVSGDLSLLQYSATQALKEAREYASRGTT